MSKRVEMRGQAGTDVKFLEHGGTEAERWQNKPEETVSEFYKI